MAQTAKQNTTTTTALTNLYWKAISFVSCFEVISPPISLAPAIVLSPRNKMRAARREQWKLHPCTHVRARGRAITSFLAWEFGLEAWRRPGGGPVSYTHLRAHETVLDLVCRLLLEKK